MSYAAAPKMGIINEQTGIWQNAKKQKKKETESERIRNHIDSSYTAYVCDGEVSYVYQCSEFDKEDDSLAN